MYRGRAIVEKPTKMVCAKVKAKQCISSKYFLRNNLIENCILIEVNVRKDMISNE
jgi:hypothetical protein